MHQIHPNSNSPVPDLVRGHKTALAKMGQRIDDFSPEYTIAISRSGPRLLELMKKEGLIYNDADVYTEKALQFLNKDVFRGSRVVIFDDITNSGRTLYQLHNQLDWEGITDRFQTITFAVDKDTCEIPIEATGAELAVSSSKRYELVKRTTQSFSYLNKPYDVDHPIFYTNIDDEKFHKFVRSQRSYEITTEGQSKAGFRRFTFFPNRTFKFSRLINSMLDIEVQVDINKIRVYYKETGQITTNPILSFPISAEELEKDSYFSKDLPDIYNQLMKAGKRQLESIPISRYNSNTNEALYRLFWYLANYLFGVASHERFECLPKLEEPNISVNDQDIKYLFGESLGMALIKGLNEAFEPTKEDINKKELSDISESDSTKPIPSPQSKCDQSQTELYNTLYPYVKENSTNEMTYSDQLASVFEGTQLTLEVSRDNQEQNVMNKGHPIERKVGLNLTQLRELIYDTGIVPGEEDDIGFSLALDFLVDAGVAIPMFYQKGDSEVYERVFRHGEGALNRTGYAYAIDEIASSLWSEIGSNNEKINKVTLEKIGVMINDRFHEDQYWGSQTVTSIYNFLQKNGRPKSLKIAPEYYRHGRVVLLDNLVTHDRQFFAEWCDTHNIVNELNDGGYVRGPGWKNNHQEDLHRAASTIKPGEIAALESMAYLLYEVDTDIDDSKQSDYLVALTTCRHPVSYLKAIRKEIVLFFEHDEYSISKSISYIEDMVDRYNNVGEGEFVDRSFDSLKEEIEGAKEQLKSAREPIYDINRKERLRDDIEDSSGTSEIIEDIRKYFRKSDNSYQNSAYKQNLKPYLDNIEEIDHYTPKALDRIIEKTEIYGKLCINFTDLLLTSLALIEKIAESKTNVRGKIKDFQNAADDFNSIIERNGGMFYDTHYLDEVHTIDIEVISIKSLDLNEFNQEELENQDIVITLIQELFSTLCEMSNILEDIYSDYFENDNWNVKMKDLADYGNRIEANWVVWYDLKNSSDPRKEEQINGFKENIEQKLDTLNNGLNDCYFEYSDDDEKHIFVKNKSNIKKVISAIFSEATLQGIDFRMGVCKTRSGYIEFSDGDKIETTKSHILVSRIGDVSKAKNLENNHNSYFSIPNNIVTDIWEDKQVLANIGATLQTEELGEYTRNLNEPNVNLDIKIFEISD
jgi:hypoxanthine phosphoribosyltransferase